MRGRVGKQHTIDILFVLTLFCVFALSALAVVYIGSRVYSATVDTMDVNFHNNVTMDYIVEKVHQGDNGGNIKIEKKDGIEVLAIHQTFNNQPYTTYIYLYKGQLKELFINNQDSFHKEDGENIMAVNALSMKIELSVLSIDFTINDKSNHCYISLIKGEH